MTDFEVLEVARLMVEYNWSLRVLADNTNYGKSHIHRALTNELRFIDDDLYWQCQTIMKKHKEEPIRDRTGRFTKRN